MQTTVQAAPPVPPPAPPPAPVVDPNLAIEQQQANQANITALQAQAQGDTASLMARYGTKLAIANVMAPSAPGATGTV